MSKTIVKCSLDFKQEQSIISLGFLDLYSVSDSAIKNDIIAFYVNNEEYTQFVGTEEDFLDNTSAGDKIYYKKLELSGHHTYYIKENPAPTSIFFELRDYFATEMIRIDGKTYKPYLLSFPKIKDEIKLKEVIVPKSMDISLENTSKYFQEMFTKSVFLGSKINFDDFSIVIDKVSYEEQIKIGGKEILYKLEALSETLKHSYTINSEVVEDSEYKRTVYGKLESIKTKFNREDLYNNYFPNGRDQLTIEDKGGQDTLTGTPYFSATDGSKLITGTGTKFLRELTPGDTLELWRYQYPGGIITTVVVDYIIDDESFMAVDPADSDYPVPGNFPSEFHCNHISVKDGNKDYIFVVKDGESLVTGWGTKFLTELKQGDIISCYRYGRLEQELKVKRVINDETLFLEEPAARSFKFHNSKFTISVNTDKYIDHHRRFDICSHKLAEFDGATFEGASVSYNSTISAFECTLADTFENNYLLEHLEENDYIIVRDYDDTNPEFFEVIFIDKTTREIHIDHRKEADHIGSPPVPATGAGAYSKIKSFPVSNVKINDKVISPACYTLTNTDDGAYITFDDDYETSDLDYYGTYELRNMYRTPYIPILMIGAPARGVFRDNTDSNQTYTTVGTDFHGATISVPINDDPYVEPARVVFINDRRWTGSAWTDVFDTYFQDNWDVNKDIPVYLEAGDDAVSYTSEQLVDLVIEAVKKTGRYWAEKTSNYSCDIFTLFPKRYYPFDIDETYYNQYGGQIENMVCNFEISGAEPSEVGGTFSVFPDKIKVGDWIHIGDWADSPDLREVLAVEDYMLFYREDSGQPDFDTELFEPVIDLFSLDRLKESSVVSCRVSGKVSKDTNLPFMTSPKQIIEDIMIKAGLSDEITDLEAIADDELMSFEPFIDYEDPSDYADYRAIEQKICFAIPEKIEDEPKSFKAILKQINESFRTYLTRSTQNKKWGVDFISGNNGDSSDAVSKWENSLYSPLALDITEDKTFSISMIRETKNIINKIDYEYDYNEYDNTWKSGSLSSTYSSGLIKIENTLKTKFYVRTQEEAEKLAQSYLNVREKPDILIKAQCWKTVNYEVGQIVKVYNSNLPTHTQGFWYGIITKKDVKGDKITYDITDFGGLLNE